MAALTKSMPTKSVLKARLSLKSVLKMSSSLKSVLKMSSSLKSVLKTSLLNVPIDNGVGALSIGVRANQAVAHPPYKRTPFLSLPVKRITSLAPAFFFFSSRPPRPTPTFFTRRPRRSMEPRPLRRPRKTQPIIEAHLERRKPIAERNLVELPRMKSKEKLVRLCPTQMSDTFEPLLIEDKGAAATLKEFAFSDKFTATSKKMQHANRTYSHDDGVMHLLIHCGLGLSMTALQDARARRLLPLSLSVARVASDIDEIEDGFASLVLDDGSTTIPNSLPAGSADNVDIPLRFVIQAALAIILYLLVDLQRKASRFSMIAACLKTESAHPARLV
ncbi:hypothetical protein DFJ58DRAFT_846933 [Suillus subalutaceus]|uniref:uncharacterized protein n=1 Tax=Suillus subalutaceus TaxID=48586 RepID=UPI001B87E3C1|nr:uncharacterized protein DFJ58DRAFT_846933 [Suillus subalutaceus]KAG1836517.1 hypothetical protein DFJ58DRAFT_846933 [Suillus subalutaceus]